MVVQWCDPGGGVPVGSNFAAFLGGGGGEGGGTGWGAWRDLAPETSLDYRCRGGLALAIKIT